MSIHAPGRIGICQGAARRGMGAVAGAGRGGLGRALAKVFPSTTPLGSPRRGGVPGLSMTSMIDVLVVLTVFLLLTFTSSAECGCTRDLSHLPMGGNTDEMLDAPIVHVSALGITLDGTPVASADEMTAMVARAQRIDTLFNSLKAKHETSNILSPNRPPPTHVVIAIDGEVPAGVVKSIVLTASRSGYPSIDFMVHAAPRG